MWDPPDVRDRDDTYLAPLALIEERHPMQCAIITIVGMLMASAIGAAIALVGGRV